MTKVNTLSKLVLICGLATATLGAGSVLAKGGMHDKQGHSQARFLLSERGADKLDLTQEQQTKLEAIFEAQKTQMKAVRGDDKEARKAQRKAQKEKMDALLSAPTFDENAAKELLAARHEKGTEFGLIKLKTQHQVMQVLNAEQQEKFAKMQKRMGKKHRKQRD
ncbi:MULTISPECIES: Spy/CpxP family protein refolding chaperone [unclassified Pseudoalteromonas]|uniref:Spy/CpxP family protein refolding chaperone n=1 Tax=unclassified Pseudoalteromonas TaxID=194690 RepID=UPI0003F4D724|nr:MULTISPECIES: Spy/CpxP family protein refolding chaperone [unclassified Pseudoalteromonas]MDC9502688.1 Spy/CpxP family protein refolding chaperone [Pseudoalteromonas sp. Angola-18]MDC9530387.1 Spy/CpxP family protein refolding chaperone [Pseudoalteromonas sp. Angola-7]TMP79352.1 ATP-independent periplasmic protein-refolding chaperone [Pseudoalteromonas sp. S983]